MTENLITKTYNIEISASNAQVWFILWDDFYYRAWTRFFSEGSYAVSDWELNGSVHFLKPDGSGMFSEITGLAPDQFMEFTHKGTIKNFETQAPATDSFSWTGFKESYSLTASGNNTLLTVSVDTLSDFESFMDEKFLLALNELKILAENFKIRIYTEVNASIEKVWDYYTQPLHITKWNAASDDWQTTKASVDLQVGGQFSYWMEAKDGSVGFDFYGNYTKIEPHLTLHYTLGDSRTVAINFQVLDNSVSIEMFFEAENQNLLSLQKYGWQAILNKFKNYTEAH